MSYFLKFNKTFLTYSLILLILIPLFGFNFLISFLGNILLILFLIPVLLFLLLFISFKGLLGNLWAFNLDGIIIAILFIIMRPRDAKKFGNFKFFF